jgi:hypothetical protein
MFRSSRRGLSWSLATTAAVAAFAVLAIPQAQANHIETAGGGFGHDNNIPAGFGTGNLCNVNDGCFIAEDTSTGDGSTGLIGRHSGFSGGTSAPFGAGIFGDSNSQSINAVGIYGRVAPVGQHGSGSAGVRGDNGGVGTANADTAGVYGYNSSVGYGVRGYSEYGDGLYALTNSTISGVAGVYGTSSGASTYGVRGANYSGVGVLGTGATGVSGTGTLGVQGQSDSTSASAVGVQGTITSTTPGGASAGVRGRTMAQEARASASGARRPGPAPACTARARGGKACTDSLRERPGSTTAFTAGQPRRAAMPGTSRGPCA